MALHDELLNLALELVNRHPATPVEGDLRRAVSTAYYALFSPFLSTRPRVDWLLLQLCGADL